MNINQLWIHLKYNLYDSTEHTPASREEEEPRGNKLHKVVGQHLKLVEELRGLVQEVADWVGHGLRLVVVVHTGQVPPALVPTQLYQTCTKHDPEYQPSEENTSTSFV